METWVGAWQRALYGPSGFYRSPTGPAGHFTTATHGPTGRVLAEALLRLATENGLTHVVDVGAGRGELLTHLYAAQRASVGGSPTVALTGVDVVARPDGLPDDVRWLHSPGGAALPDGLDGLTDALVVAHEWLDVVPCTIAEVDDDGTLRERLVDPATGTQAWGEPVRGDELGWAEKHWPTTQPDTRVEIGLSRDHAWRDLLSRIDHGLALAIDYGHTAATRPPLGSLTAYRDGHQVAPVPDGSSDLTAHVAMDSLEHDDLVDQRTALRRLGVHGSTPPVALARAEPTVYLAALEQASAATALTAPGGFGDFLWAFSRRG